MRKLLNFLKALRKDYLETSVELKEKKKVAFLKALKYTLLYLFEIVTAPLFYPIWYMFRKTITLRMYDGVIVKYISDSYFTDETIKAFKAKGKLLYFLWTYGDMNDPLGRGGMPEYYKDGRNSFKNRFLYSAIRNPRFTYHFVEFHSGIISTMSTVKDTLHPDIKYKSDGVGAFSHGILFRWFYTEKGDAYFIYEDADENSVLWFGFVGLKRAYVGRVGRFEIAFRRLK